MAPRRPTSTATVSFAEIGFARGYQQPLQGAASALLESLIPGTEVLRYGRFWRMARTRREDDFVSCIVLG